MESLSWRQRRGLEDMSGLVLGLGDTFRVAIAGVGLFGGEHICKPSSCISGLVYISLVRIFLFHVLGPNAYAGHTSYY